MCNCGDIDHRNMTSLMSVQDWEDYIDLLGNFTFPMYIRDSVKLPIFSHKIMKRSLCLSTIQNRKWNSRKQDRFCPFKVSTYGNISVIFKGRVCVINIQLTTCSLFAAAHFENTIVKRPRKWITLHFKKNVPWGNICGKRTMDYWGWPAF